MARPAPLLLVAGLSLLLNLAGLDWGLPSRWHPDEKADVVLGMARDRSLAPDSFINPSLPLYAMLPAIGLQHLLADAGALRGLAADPLLPGRALSAFAGAGSVLLLGLAVRRHAPALGLLPPVFLALFPLVINVCHFATPEAWLLLGTSATLGLSLDHLEGRSGVVPLGLVLGLTASTKYTAAALVVPALLAVGLRPRAPGDSRDRCVLGAAGLALLTLGAVLLGATGEALGARLHLRDARLLHPENALAFVRGLGRAAVGGGAALVAIAALAAPRAGGAPGAKATPLARLRLATGRLARREAVWLLLAAAFGFLLGTPMAARRPLAFLSDLAYNAQTRMEYKGLTGETTSFLPYATLFADAVTLPALAAALAGALKGVAGAGGKAKPLIVTAAFVAPYLLVAASGHRALRFLAHAWPAAAWLAPAALLGIRDRAVRRTAVFLVVSRLALAALLVLRLFFVDSRRLAARYLEAKVPAGATLDLITNHAGYAPTPDGRALRIVPTLSREMAPVERFQEAARAYPASASTWLVLTASFYERFLDHPDQQPERAAFFRDLLSGRGGFEVAARFRQPGFLRPPNEFLDPEIVVLRKR